MAEYTPTTERVTTSYVSRQSRVDRAMGAKHPAEYEAEFDRWLAAHDAEVARKAWDEGAKAQADYYNIHVNTDLNPYRAQTVD